MTRLLQRGLVEALPAQDRRRPHRSTPAGAEAARAYLQRAQRVAARWRERYGAELEQLVRNLRPSTSTVAIAVDLVKGALHAHVQQGIDVQIWDRRAITRDTLIAGTVWLGLSAEILVFNLVLPSKTDEDAVFVLVSYRRGLADCRHA